MGPPLYGPTSAAEGLGRHHLGTDEHVDRDLDRVPRLQLQAQLPYVEEFTDGQVKTIGSLEVLAAFGLILPSVLRVAPLLSAAAAVGLVLLMIGAIATHVQRGEVNSRLSINVVLLAVALIVAWARFGPYQL